MGISFFSHPSLIVTSSGQRQDGELTKKSRERNNITSIFGNRIQFYLRSFVSDLFPRQNFLKHSHLWWYSLHGPTKLWNCVFAGCFLSEALILQLLKIERKIFSWNYDFSTCFLHQIVLNFKTKISLVKTIPFRIDILSM